MEMSVVNVGKDAEELTVDVTRDTGESALEFMVWKWVDVSSILICVEDTAASLRVLTQ